jgi:hypothetical protein
MPFNRGNKALANENKYPFVIELHVAATGLDRELNDHIVGFHKARLLIPRFGRSALRDGETYYRWCFSDLETARAFAEQFGGRSTNHWRLSTTRGSAAYQFNRA